MSVSVFTPADKLIKRYFELKKQGKSFGKKILEPEDPDNRGLTGTHLVKFRKNFNAFADDVAVLLKHKMIYGSDGGKRARGIVRANGVLKVIHNAYLDSTVAYEEGQELHLRIIMVRVRDTVPPNRWVVGVDFRSPIFQDDWDFENGERVEGTPCSRLQTMFALAEFESVKALGKPKAEKVRLLIDCANRVGCPKSLDLWCYNRVLLTAYTSPLTDDKSRKSMTKKTRGKLPLDGMSMISPHAHWRIYPFKQMLSSFPRSTPHRGVRAARFLYNIWNEADQSMGELYKNVQKGAMMSGMMKRFPWQDEKAARLVWGLAAPIFKHIHDRRKKNSGHLYSCFPVTK